jgi:hypothetical protein
MAQILVKWAIELDASKRMAITPRRLEYIGQAIRLFNNDTEMIASSVMSGTVQPQDFKILTMRMAPIFGNTDVTNTKTSAKINGMLQTQLELNKDALARAIEMAQGNVNT